MNNRNLIIFIKIKYTTYFKLTIYNKVRAENLNITNLR
jgi:hypothetical protein